MARTNNPDSATSQFFINLVDNLNLNSMGHRPGYAVFGQVTSGLDTVDKIGRAKTGNHLHYRNVPKEPIVIINAKRI